MERIRTSIIGLGPWGQKVALKLSELSDFQLVALADRSFPQLETFSAAVGATPFRQINSLINFYIPDLLVIATPVESHLELIKAALEKGCHVWVTKPILLHSQELSEVLAFAEKKNLKIFFDHTFVFSSRFQAIQDFLPLLSPPVSIEAKRGHWGGWKTGDTALEELIYHDIYMVLRWSQQKPMGVSFKTFGGSEPKEQTEQLTLHFDSKADSSLICNLQASHGWKERVRSTVLKGTDWQIDWNDDLKVQPIKIQKPGHQSGELIANELGPDAIQKQFQNVAQVLKNNAKAQVSAQEALDVLKIIELARKSKLNSGSMQEHRDGL